jgi:hypothetical protein
MAEVHEDGQDRRSFTRTPVPRSRGLTVRLHGFDESGQRIDAIGIPVNLSRGGVLARTDVPLSADRPCLGHFSGAGGGIVPEYAPGRIIRLGQEADQFLVALEFNPPLRSVNLPWSPSGYAS